MIEDVTVVDGFSGEVRKTHSEAPPLSCGHEHDILPGSFWLAMSVEDLEGVCVQVEGMIHGSPIDDLPIFNRPEPHSRIHAVMIEDLPVNLEAHATTCAAGLAEHKTSKGKF